MGAPNGTFPGGLNLAGIDGSEAVNDTGLVYVCPITPGDCEPLSGTGSGNDVRLFDHEGQWGDENTIHNRSTHTHTHTHTHSIYIYSLSLSLCPLQPIL